MKEYELLKAKETMDGWDVHVQGGEINGCHQGITGKRSREGMENFKKMVSVFVVGWQEMDNGLEMGINIHENTLTWGVIVVDQDYQVCGFQGKGRGWVFS